MDVYNALIGAGLTGVSYDGSGDVILNDNFSGQTPLTLGISLDSSITNQDSWISVGVGSAS